MSKIYILSGPIQTGKTTRLAEWVKNQKNIDGVLAPLIEGERHLLHISSSESQSLEKPCNEEDQLKIGRFVFNELVFSWAREKLLEIDGSKSDWLIFDEIGPLELNGQGLEPAISSLIKDFSLREIKILFVIREGLVQKVLEKYSIEKKEVTSFTFP